jgi:hypothetical protein
MTEESSRVTDGDDDSAGEGEEYAEVEDMGACVESVSNGTGRTALSGGRSYFCRGDDRR